MIRNQKHEKKMRLQSKTVDNSFARAVQQGLNCSPFEAEAIVKLARSTYQSDDHKIKNLQPGQMVITVISELEGARKKIKEASTVKVVITVDAPEDVQIREKQGVSRLRQHRLMRVCQEALEQGGLMTVEDLAHRIFNVGERTIIRDLSELRKDRIVVPLRSTVRDIGRTITHKEQIIQLWLKGKQYGYISQALHHSTNAIKNYVETFKRIVVLSKEGHTKSNIAFLVGASPTLVESYLSLWKKLRSKAIPSRLKEVEEPILGQIKLKRTTDAGSAKKGGVAI